MLIGLTGKKYSGKDTLANFLVEKNYIKYSMATPLKNCLVELFGFNDNQINGEFKEIVDSRWGVTPREVMQFFGTQVMQYKMQELIPNIGRNFFVKRLDHYYQLNKNKNIVIADVRFQHEINYIKKEKGIIIKIVRDIDTEHANSHISEKGIDDLEKIDFIINNNGNKEDAFEQLTQIIEKKNVDYI